MTRFSHTRLWSVAVLCTCLAIVGASLALGATAMAAPGGCPSTYGCIWAAPNYESIRGQWAGSNSNLAEFKVSEHCAFGSWKWCDKSVWNNGSSCNLSWYTEPGYGGSEYRNNLGTGQGEMGGWNDEFAADLWCHY
jgi:hypothetical protein